MAQAHAHPSTTSIAEPALPHGPLEPVFDNIWFVRGTWKMPFHTRIVRSMTVLREPESGELTLVNSIRLSEIGLRQLEALGPVKHVIRLASQHGADDGFYRDRYGAKIYALEDTLYTRGLKPDVTAADNYFEADQSYNATTELPIADAHVIVMKTAYQSDASLLLDREGGILISGDFFHNNQPTLDYFNGLARVGMRLFGLAKPYQMGVAWLATLKPSRSELLALLDLPFEHVLPIHGEPVLGNAKEKYRPAIERAAAKART